MKKHLLSLVGVLCLCVACLALGAAGALLWVGEGSLPAAPRLSAQPAPAVPTAAPSPAAGEAEVPQVNPAIADNGLPKDQVYVTDARKGYQSGSMRLRIPALQVDVPVLDGVDPDTLLKGVGLYDYAQLPGEGGANVSIAGHRNGLRGGQITDNMPFYYLNTLTEGDYLYLTHDGTVYRYLWECTQVIEPDDWSVIFNQGYGCITLTTCTPIGVADHRLVVRGALVDSYPENSPNPYPANTSKE